MFLGRFRAGEFVRIPVHVRDGGTPYAQGPAPVITIYDSSAAKVGSLRMPPVDKGSLTGMFVGRLRLDASYPTGLYRYSINFLANSTVKLVVGHFEVVDGGQVDGGVVSTFFYPRPHANFLVQRLDSDQRLITKNPRIS